MTALDDLIAQIELEFGVARAQSSRMALFYLQRSYELGVSVGELDLRAVVGSNIGEFRTDPRRLEHLSRYSFGAINDIERIGRERVRDVFRRAADDATLDSRGITRLLRSELYDSVEDFRIPVIARTETNRAGNAAKVDRYRAARIEHHEALTAEDDRVRDFETSGADHTAVNGQVRKIGEAFDIPRTRGGPNDNGDRYPPFDPNCRCTVVPVVPVEGSLGAPVVRLAARGNAQRLRDWRRVVGTYGGAMALDLKLIWRQAFERVDRHIQRHGDDALRASRLTRSL